MDVAIIGAGAVGLATAALLASRGDSVIVLEQHARFGQETSSRNSGVIHAGLYYPPGSLKAELCVRGRELVYARAARDAIAHRRTGKLIVACEAAERARLEEVHARGMRNGAGELRWLEAAELRAEHPRVRALAGLWSPDTGIVDAHGLMQSYWAQAQTAGAVLGLRTHLTAIEACATGYRLCARASDGQAHDLAARRIVNAAGLHAFDVAALAGLDTNVLGRQLHLCKGDYFTIAARLRDLTEHLIYPLPAGAGLGIHVTVDLGGILRAGPDTEYVAHIDYAVCTSKQLRFAAALRRYLPEIRDDDLSPAYSGIRPKLHGPEQSFADFVIEDAAPHGLPGMINLLGIESPGLTASEAIAQEVLRLLPT